jgi:hypothetical protein
MCFGGFHPAKNVEVPPTPVGGAPLNRRLSLGGLFQCDLIEVSRIIMIC